MIVDMVYRTLSHNWNSILPNGQSHGLFRSSRGIKQGDLMSPTLFIMTPEALSRDLNALHDNPNFIGYGMLK